MRESQLAVTTNQGMDHCTCQPLSTAPMPALQGRSTPALIPVAPELGHSLHTCLQECFPRATAFSLLLLHIVQFEHIPMPPEAPVVHKRRCSHAPASLLIQIIEAMRRSLRVDDEILHDDAGTGAVLLFPEVDQSGIARIAERVSRTIQLLQAETIIPPLRAETQITLGYGSYPRPASSLEKLLYDISQPQEKITFRPVLSRDSLHTLEPLNSQATDAHTEELPALKQVPFMQLPDRLPAHLQRLVPYHLALELCCAPVGRDHHRLTVAMANPTNSYAICSLHKATGMSIFPVSCEITALERLLASGW